MQVLGTAEVCCTGVKTDLCGKLKFLSVWFDVQAGALRPSTLADRSKLGSCCKVQLCNHHFSFP